MARIGKLLLDCFLCCVVAFVSLIFMSVTATFVTAAWIWSIVQEASGKVKMQVRLNQSSPPFLFANLVLLFPSLLGLLSHPTSRSSFPPSYSSASSSSTFKKTSPFWQAPVA